MSTKILYIGKRLLFAALTVLLLTSITFLLMHMLPGTPFVGEKNLRPEVEAALIAKYGLDLPIWQQYMIYMGHVIQGDLGSSLVSGRQVTQIISQAFPISLELGIRALCFAVFLGLFLGAVAGVKRGTAQDTLVMLIALVAVSVPSFIMGALLQYFFGLLLYEATGIRFFPIIGWSGEQSKLLPSFALAFGSVAVISRLMRSSLLEVLNQDYIRTALVKGLSKKEVVLHHGIRNAILPVVTVLGPMTAVLLTGTFAIEHIFVIPGLGKYFVDSIRANDYPVIVGTTLFYGTFLVLCNLAVDILHSLIDPRVELGGGAHG